MYALFWLYPNVSSLSRVLLEKMEESQDYGCAFILDKKFDKSLGIPSAAVKDGEDLLLIWWAGRSLHPMGIRVPLRSIARLLFLRAVGQEAATTFYDDYQWVRCLFWGVDRSVKSNMCYYRMKLISQVSMHQFGYAKQPLTERYAQLGHCPRCITWHQAPGLFLDTL